MAVLITDRAIARFDHLQAQRSGFPRIEIRAGGCNGFEKIFAWTDAPEQDDIEIVTKQGKILIDPISYQLLENAIVDYQTDLTGSAFSIKVPEAVSTCGCGASFSL